MHVSSRAREAESWDRRDVWVDVSVARVDGVERDVEEEGERMEDVVVVVVGLGR